MGGMWGTWIDICEGWVVCRLGVRKDYGDMRVVMVILLDIKGAKIM
jgi:hypothetical protein